MLFAQRFASHDIFALFAASLNGLQRQMPTDAEEFEKALREHARAFGVETDDRMVSRLSEYYRLVMKWNPRLHLVAPCTAQQFATRHVLESLIVLPHVAPNAHIVDIGPGAGLPSIPCLIVREDIHATLIESSKRKAVFLTEALRELELANRAEVIPARFQDIAAPPADAFMCRALERFESALTKLIEWAPSGSSLLLFGGERLLTALQALLPDAQAELIPSSQRRLLIIASTK